MKNFYTLIELTAAINWLGLAHTDGEICSSSLLSAGQKRLCDRHQINPIVIPTAAKQTIAACKQSMKSSKWGCRISRKNTESKEHAYINALSTAQLVISTERICQMGQVKNCNPKVYAQQMISLEKTKSTLEQKIRRHNVAVGIKKLRQKTEQKCRCHGQSGACTTKTCWMESPSPLAIADELKAEYDQAVQVKSDKNEENLIPIELALLTPFFGERLLFTREEADYCPTTKGRACQINDPTKESHCQNLCCGRGYITKKFKVEKQGKCAFQWPDKITCAEPTVERRTKFICL